MVAADGSLRSGEHVEQEALACGAPRIRRRRRRGRAASQVGMDAPGQLSGRGSPIDDIERPGGECDDGIKSLVPQHGNGGDQ
ncbi:hypothetical protein QFZ82_007737 [Streptomyces sp. V4I23]|jgi:hypothetical protein|uniref:hypothetical protein n=1 Tax=Streptomyces sp. V4I23 TaxID=3042282 RepID=UPI0027839296|nr:hypothetical protein [Streptomyces sp. V4I23]MDQ1013252.1 hypothetical protein [Streptomyces sp. V4I23]